jgi:hypothetical protein
MSISARGLTAVTSATRRADERGHQRGFGEADGAGAVEQLRFAPREVGQWARHRRAGIVDGAQFRDHGAGILDAVGRESAEGAALQVFDRPQPP